ncbi:F-actin-capping protein subunit alpha, partial [Kipferlia bialata]
TRPASEAEVGMGGQDSETLPFTLADMRAAANQMCKDHYPLGAVEVFAQGGEYHIVCASGVAKPAAFWTGNFTARYRVFQSQAGVVIDGKMGGVSHFYEKGNVSAELDQPIASEIDLEGSTADKVFERINLMEVDYFSRVEECLETLQQGPYKKVRRYLPVSGHKLEWNQYSLGGMRINE